MQVPLFLLSIPRLLSTAIEARKAKAQRAHEKAAREVDALARAQAERNAEMVRKQQKRKRAKEEAAIREKIAAENAGKSMASENRNEEAINDAGKPLTGSNAPWTELEMSFLFKAVAKFPGGTRNRWDTIANYVNTQARQDFRRSAKNCIAQASRVNIRRNPRHQNRGATSASQQGDAGKEQGSTFAWTEAQQKELESALRKYPASMDKRERWKLIASDVKGQNVKACVARYKEIRAQLMKTK